MGDKKNQNFYPNTIFTRRRVFSRNNTNNLCFRRGYLLMFRHCKLNIEALNLNHWNQVELGDFRIFYCPLVDITISVDADIQILMLGYAINPFHLKIANTNQAILKYLVQELAKSKKHFFDALNELTGRFVLLVVQNNQAFIVQDAVGLKSCFYTQIPNELLMSSHPGLIAELLELKVDALAVKISEHPKHLLGGRYLPGVMTPFKPVKQLLANTYFQINERKVIRFFPSEVLTPNASVDEKFLKKMSMIFDQQNVLLFSRFKVALSLTAGLDSRMSLALTKNFRSQISTFTYIIWGNKSHKIDADIANELASRFDFHHEKISYSRQDSHDEAHDAIARTYGGLKRSSSVNAAYFEYFPSNLINMRSNISEVFRGNWNRNPSICQGVLNLETMLNLYKKSVKELCRDAWEEYMVVQSPLLNDHWGYDPIDMFYWEHRMSNWLALVLLDADVSHETFIHYNNRKILNEFLSITLQDRLSDSIPKAFIDYTWPELMDLPINPKVFPETK